MVTLYVYVATLYPREQIIVGPTFCNGWRHWHLNWRDDIRPRLADPHMFPHSEIGVSFNIKAILNIQKHYISLLYKKKTSLITHLVSLNESASLKVGKVLSFLATFEVRSNIWLHFERYLNIFDVKPSCNMHKTFELLMPTV